MPSVLAADGSISFTESNAEFAPSALDLPLPMIIDVNDRMPLFGRGTDGSLALITGLLPSDTYNINQFRSDSQWCGFGWIGGVGAVAGTSVLTYSSFTIQNTFLGVPYVGAPGLPANTSWTSSPLNGNTSTYTCSVSSGSALVSGLSSTSSFAVGQVVSISGMPIANQVITAINNSTTITVNQNAISTSASASLHNNYWVSLSAVPAFYWSDTPRNFAFTNQSVQRAVDAPIATVSSITSNQTLSCDAAGSTSVSDFKVGDVVIVWNAKGDATFNTNVGNFELANITSVLQTSSTHVGIVLRDPLVGLYGSVNNSAIGSQKVLVMRIPEYVSINIPSGVTMSANAWDGSAGGLLAFFSLAVSMSGTGKISMQGSGYTGATVAGFRGEGTQGGLSSSTSPIGSAGGGGGNGAAGSVGLAGSSITITATNNTGYGGAGGGGGGGGGAGAGGGGGYAGSGGAGGAGGGGGGGAGGMSNQNSLNFASSGAAGSGSSGGSGGAAQTSISSASATYFATSGHGGNAGASASSSSGGSSAGQAVLSQILMGGGGGAAGSGAKGGNGGNGGNVTTTTASSAAIGGNGGGAGGNGGGLSVSGSVATGGIGGTASGALNYNYAGDNGGVGISAGATSGVGGNGGGIVLAFVKSLIAPTIIADGNSGGGGGSGGKGANTAENVSHFPGGNGGGPGGGGGGGGGGGSGSGGTVYVFSAQISSINTISAIGGFGSPGGGYGLAGTNDLGVGLFGGAGSTGGNGGAGANGRVKVEYQSLNGVCRTRSQGQGASQFGGSAPTGYVVSL